MKQIKLMQGDNILSLKKLPDNSVDSIVTDLLKTYTIKDNGIVINNRTNKEVKFSIDGKGYMRARSQCKNHSTNDDGRKPFRLHRLVAMIYLKNFSNELQVNHIDGNKQNNNVSNLEMVTASQNVYHSWNVLDSDNRKKSIKRDEAGKFISRR